MISTDVVHPALVSEADFVAVQNLLAASVSGQGLAHRYQLVGLLRCGLCGRALDFCWSHGRAAYRCRHGQTSARPRRGRAGNIYVREDRITAIIRGLLGDADTESSDASLADILRQQDRIVNCTESVCSLERA